MAEDVRFSIPEAGLVGLKALISLGPEGVTALCELAKDLSLTLNIRGLTNRLSSELNVETRVVSQFVMGALMPLNHLRVHLKLETLDFLKALSDTLEKEAPEKWRSENLVGWKAIEGRVVPLFERDNFFSVSNKSYQLLVNRPNPVQNVQILTELRPVYSEDATSVRAFVLAKTLVVDYFEGDTKKTIHLSMDMDDLRSLASEVDRAKLKRETVSEEVFGWGVDLLTYGYQG
jgi:hypothetical protein